MIKVKARYPPRKYWMWTSPTEKTLVTEGSRVRTSVIYRYPQVVWDKDQGRYVSYILKVLGENSYYIKTPMVEARIVKDKLILLSDGEDLVKQFWVFGVPLTFKSVIPIQDGESVNFMITLEGNGLNVILEHLFTKEYVKTTIHINRLSEIPVTVTPKWIHKPLQTVKTHEPSPLFPHYKIALRNKRVIVSWKDAESHYETKYWNPSIGLTVKFKARILHKNETYIIDPYTFTFGSQDIDGYLWRQGATYPPTTTYVDDYSSAFYVGQNYSTGGDYYIYRGYVSFDTRSLQNVASILSAKLRLYGADSLGDTFTMYIYNCSYGSTLDTSDWNVTATEITSFNTADFQASKWFEWSIPTSALNISGLTQFTFRSSQDINGITPVQAEWIRWYASESDYDPQLQVTYILPTPTYAKVSETWLFAEEKYYDFEVELQDSLNMSYGMIAFSDIEEAYCLEFDGTVGSYVSASLPSLINSTGAVEFWFKCDTTGDQRYLFHIYQTGGEGTDYITARRDADGRVNVIAEDGNVQQFILTSTSNISTEWTHIVIVQNGSGVGLYIDGRLEDSSNSTWWLDELTSWNLRIPAIFFGNILDGKIDEFRIYSDYIHQGEISYNRIHREPVETSLYLVYHMDEGSGSTLHDYSGNGYSASIVGSPIWSIGKILKSVNWVIAYYKASSEEWELWSGSEIAQLKAGAKTVEGNTTWLTFKIYLKSTVLDKLNADLYIYANDTSGGSVGWIVHLDLFNIYSQGGIPAIISSGNASRITGGGVFDLYSEGGSYVIANLTYRNLQSFHAIFHITINDWDIWDIEEADICYYEFGIDYYYRGIWIRGWSVSLELENAWIGASEQRLTWNITWYWKGQKVSTALLNSFPVWQGGADDPVSTSFILDLWYSIENGSTIAGGRITSEYYAMRDNSNPWLRWATGSNWGVIVTNVTQLMFFHQLEDEYGNVISCRQITLSRLWAKIDYQYRSGIIPARTEIRDWDNFEIKIAKGEMEGVNTPHFVPTKTPDMPQGGFFAVLYSAITSVFDRIVHALSLAGLTAWNTFVGFMDTVFATFGYPNLFSNLISWLNSFGTWLIYSMTQLITLLTYIYNFIKQPLFTFLWVFQLMLTGWLDIIIKVKGIIDGTITGTVNLWTYFNFSYWASLVPIMFVIYEMDKCSRAGSLQPAIDDMKLLMDILVFIIDLFLKIANFFLNLIGRIIESIPVVE